MALHEKFCTRCGAKVTRGMRFCGDCGERVEWDESVLSPIITFVRKNAVVLAAVAGVILLALVAIMSIGGGADLRDVAERLDGNPAFLRVEEDGKMLLIDTNPEDLYDTSYVDAWSMILAAIRELELPLDELKAAMNATTPMDGIVTREYADVTVSWQYHPDKGLEVLFEAK